MKKEVIVIIAVCIVVAIITAFLTTNLTGNVVNVGWWHKEKVYTVSEVDELIKNLNSDGKTPIYYTKSEIDSLIKSLAQYNVTIIQNNNSYTKDEIDNKINSIPKGTTNRSVLTMLNACEVIRSASGVCDPVCNEKGKTCIFGDATFQYKIGNVSNTITQVVGCSESSVQSLYDLYTQAGYIVQDVDAGCVCCSA